MSGFRSLANAVAATDAAYVSLTKRFGGSEIENAAAEVARLSQLLATLSPERSGGIAEQLAAAKERLSVLGSRSGGGDSSPDGAPTTSAVERFAFQMGRMRTEVAEVAAEAERTLLSLSSRADEVGEEVKIKISKALSAILDPGTGEGVSGKWDKDSGQFQGGAFSLERARNLVDRYNELLEIQDTKLNAFQQFYVNESVKLTARQFATEFGSKLGDIRSLAKQLREYMTATATTERGTLGSTSGTLSKRPAAQQTSTSLAVLRWSGGLR